MAAYTQNTHSGPPTGGRYFVGDTVTDVNGTVWQCVVAGFPGTFVPSLAAIQATLATGVDGSIEEVGGATVTITDGLVTAITPP